MTTALKQSYTINLPIVVSTLIEYPIHQINGRLERLEP